MSIYSPIHECILQVLNLDRLALGVSLRCIVSQNSGGQDRRFALGEDIPALAEERFRFGGRVREVKVCDDSQEAGDGALDEEQPLPALEPVDAAEGEEAEGERSRQGTCD